MIKRLRTRTRMATRFHPIEEHAQQHPSLLVPGTRRKKKRKVGKRPKEEKAYARKKQNSRSTLKKKVSRYLFKRFIGTGRKKGKQSRGQHPSTFTPQPGQKEDRIFPLVFISKPHTLPFEPKAWGPNDQDLTKHEKKGKKGPTELRPLRYSPYQPCPSPHREAAFRKEGRELERASSSRSFPGKVYRKQSDGTDMVTRTSGPLLFSLALPSRSLS